MPITVLWSVEVGVVPGAGPEENNAGHHVIGDAGTCKTAPAIIEQLHQLTVTDPPRLRIARVQ